MKPPFPMALVLLMLACQPAGTPAGPRIALRPCELPGDGQRLAARCGELEVPEDRAAPAGRRVRLRIAVVPADGAQVAPDPLFLLAGGPGQSAVDAYPPALPLFRKINQRRDLVLVDQRGTGGSGGLECPPLLTALRRSDVEAAVRAAASCARELPADLRQYHTAVAADDLEAVREALGYRSRTPRCCSGSRSTAPGPWG
jgi:pimeloyl-ACP methyl ester carboxylesterase